MLLPHLDGWTAARRRVADVYAGSGLGEAVELPVETEGGKSCHHLYVVQTPGRDRLASELEAAGIGARAYYTTPPHRQPAMERFAPAAPLPEVERVAGESWRCRWARP